VKYYITRRAL